MAALKQNAAISSSWFNHDGYRVSERPNPYTAWFCFHKQCLQISVGCVLKRKCFVYSSQKQLHSKVNKLNMLKTTRRTTGVPLMRLEIKEEKKNTGTKKLKSSLSGRTVSVHQPPPSSFYCFHLHCEGIAKAAGKRWWCLPKDAYTSRMSRSALGAKITLQSCISSCRLASGHGPKNRMKEEDEEEEGEGRESYCSSARRNNLIARGGTLFPPHR